MNITPDLHEEFISWCMLAHAKHLPDSCPIAVGLLELALGEIDIEELVEIAREADDHFEESFQSLLDHMDRKRQEEQN